MNQDPFMSFAPSAFQPAALDSQRHVAPAIALRVLVDLKSPLQSYELLLKLANKSEIKITHTNYHLRLVNTVGRRSVKIAA